MGTTHDMPARPSRRGFLSGAAALGAGLTLAFHVPARGATEAAPEAAFTAAPANAYVRIGADGTVTVFSAHMEGGQGVYTGIATLVAEELDAPWSAMRVEAAWGNPKLYGNVTWGGIAQGTGGSSSIPSSWERYRTAGATARALLVQAAAKRWGVDADTITVANGILSEPAGEQLAFGELAEEAATLPTPATVALKPPSAWKLIGNEQLRRLDTVPKTNGTQPYPIDVRLPGMLTAVIARAPKFGGTVQAFDASAAKAVPGVVDVVQVPMGVAVLAEDTWAAMQGRDALKVTWDESQAEVRGSAELMAEYKRLAVSEAALAARQEGDATAAIAGAAKVVEAEFEFPYLAHAAMEPLDAVASFTDGTLEIWSGHQLPDLYQYVAGQVLGIDPAKVRLHPMTPGGFFGRRAVPSADFIVEVVSVLKASGAKVPVKLQWTREDDTRGGYYRPMYFHKLRAGLDADGTIVGWHHRVVGQSILTGTPFEAMLVKDGIDGTSVEGASTLPYATQNILVDLVTTKVQVPVLWWRAVGSTHTAYSTEVFVDELAEAAGKDPVALRRDLLRDHPRLLGVLNLAAEKAGWDEQLPEGRFRGVAVHESFNTYVAQVVELTLRPDGTPKVERAVCAVDCGIVVNPDVVRAQMEGGIGFGLGAVLKGEITLDGGAVQQGNFDGYQVLRMDEMPHVEVHIVKSDQPPTGVGEPGVPPIGPAVANAFFKATGRRIRILPFAKNDLQAA